MRRLVVIVALAAILAALWSSPSHAEKRVALVVGNSAYANVTRLDNPRRDAGLMAQVENALKIFVIAVDRVVAAAAGLDSTALNWTPAPDASSLSALGLHVTLTAMFLVRGHCVIATAKAPIAGARTLIYGCERAGHEDAEERAGLRARHEVAPRGRTATGREEPVRRVVERRLHVVGEGEGADAADARREALGQRPGLGQRPAPASSPTLARSCGYTPTTSTTTPVMAMAALRANGVVSGRASTSFGTSRNQIVRATPA